MIRLLLFHSAAFHRSSSSSRFGILASFHWTDFLLCAMKLPLQTSVCNERLRFPPNFFDGSRTLFSNFFSWPFWFSANSHPEYAAPFSSFRAAKSSPSGVAQWSLVCRVCSTHYKFSLVICAIRTHFFNFNCVRHLTEQIFNFWRHQPPHLKSHRLPLSVVFRHQSPNAVCPSVRLLLQPCVRTFHSPSPSTFTPVESIHKCNFSLKFRTRQLHL